MAFRLHTFRLHYIRLSATNENLMKLVEADTLYVDGTFQTCPRVFYQIFTIHATYAGKHIPLVYCLLPNKRQETYERVFRIIQEKADQLGLNLMPQTVLSDFELAIMQALRTIFPAAVVKGCYFHFCQALMRKVQHLHLQIPYQQNGDVRVFVRKTAALAFVPLR